MKATIFAITAAIGLVSAQLSGIPQCAIPCLRSAISVAGCPISDVGCQCSSTEAIQASAGGCILGACTAAGDLQSAISGGLGLCSAYLATVSATQTMTSSSSRTTSISATAIGSSIDTTSSALSTSDIPSLTTTSLSTTTSSSINKPATGVSGSGGRLGRGAKIGLGVGIPVALVLGLLAGWFFFGRKRKDTSKDSYLLETVPELAEGSSKPQMSSNLHPKPSEIYTQPQRPAELPGQRYS